jgi:hypothetical protein
MKTTTLVASIAIAAVISRLIDDDGDLRPDYTIKKHSDRSTSMCIKKKGNIYV